MYKNRIKLMTGKKKGKSSAPPGSNWGPRIALAEKEKARSISLPETENLPITAPANKSKVGGGESSKIGLIPAYTRKQNSYINNPPSRRNNGNPPLPPPPTTTQYARPNHKKVSMSSTGSTVSGSYSGGNNYIYNYARRASSAGAGGSCQKSFFLAHPHNHPAPPPSSRSSYSQKTSSSSNKASYVGGSSYNLGGSSSGSHVTLSTVGETMSQPLTLIIPPVTSTERLEGGGDSEFEDEHGHYNVMMERDQDSFPSTKTYCSSREDEGESSGGDDECKNEAGISDPGKDQEGQRSTAIAAQVHDPFYPSNCRNPMPSKSEQIFANPAINLGILQVSTTQPIIHYQYERHKNGSASVGGDMTQPHEEVKGSVTLSQGDKRLLHYNKREVSIPPPHPIQNNEVEAEENDTRKNVIQSSQISELRNICYSKNNKNNSIGSTISSLAQGITNIYVPMESLPRSKSAAVLNASLEFDPELSKLVQESQAQRKLYQEQKNNKNEDNHSPTSEANDPDNDSLLESFDSVMFKPRDDHGGHQVDLVPSSPSLSTGSSNTSSNISAPSTPSQPHSPNVTITNITCGCDHNQTSQNLRNEKTTKEINEKRINFMKLCPPNVTTTTPAVAPTNKQRPPPLPPKNPSMLKLKPKLKFNDNMFANIAMRNNNNHSFKANSSSPPPLQPPSASQREANIRNAVENLENIIRPLSTSPKPTPQPQLSSSQTQEDNKNDALSKPHKSCKRVTLTLPNDLAGDEQQALLNNLRADTDTEIDAYCSSFLTCGHVLKEDNYSTLSSTHSPRDKLSPRSPNSESGGVFNHDHDHGHAYHDDLPSTPEISPAHSNAHPSCSSNEHSPSSGVGGKEKNRSVLQQLRELSILIGSGGGCGGSGSYAENDKLLTKSGKDKSYPLTAKSFRLHDEDPTRKFSDASADSGKGSGTASTGSTSNTSPQSFQSSPDSLGDVELTSVPVMRSCPGANSSSSPCVFRSDCNECLMFNKPPDGFTKPGNESEICGKSSTLRSGKKGGSKKTSPSKLILRRKSSRSSKSSSKTGSSRPSRKKSKHLIFEYCDCSSCGCVEGRGGHTGGKGRPQSRPPQPPPKPSSISSIVTTGGDENGRKISNTSSSSSGGHSTGIKLSRSVAFRNSSRASLTRPHNGLNINSNKSSPLSSGDLSLTNTGLFTIEEDEENYSQSVDSKMRNGSKCISNFKNSRNSKHNSFEAINGGGGDIDVTKGSPHWHPDCWLAADPLLSGWSDLESLYSLNVKTNETPLSINGECWTCWAEISEIKRNSENPNGTVDRTKRMFIWLNKRHKEFQAPWWEAKKQASIRWVMTKALVHVPKEYLMDPFKESKKSKPIKYRLRDEVIKGLVSGKLYGLAVSNLYQETLAGGGNPGNGLCHWEIIKILSRRGVYVAQPSDMKLTEGTLRQKPIKIAAHIAMIEAIMNLYSKEILARDRINATLYTFGCTVKPETTSPEKLVIAWINAAVMTLKSYIMSTRNHQLPPEKQSRWLQLPKVGEIRDLCDGIGICSLFAIYCSNDLKPSDIQVPEPGETLTIYDSISNHTLVQKLCEQLFPETIYHLCVTDWLYIHGYMKQNILCFLVDLFIHLEVNPIVRVNRLTHVPIRVDLA